MRLVNADALKTDIEENSITLGGVMAIETACAKALIDVAPTVEAYTEEQVQEIREDVVKQFFGASVRPQGKWIIVKQDNEGVHKIECPFCHYSKGSDFSSIITVIFERFPPFCENCGAQMKGGVNND